MTRRRRIAIELLGGPLVATILAALAAVARQPSDLTADGKVLGGVLVILAAAYLVAAIPSVLCTVVMEVAFATGLDPASWRTVQRGGLRVVTVVANPTCSRVVACTCPPTSTST